MPPLTSASQADLVRARAMHHQWRAYYDTPHDELRQRIEGIADRFPHINPATVMVMSEYGYHRDSPEVARVAELQLKKDADDTRGLWGSIKRVGTSVWNKQKEGLRNAVALSGVPIETVQGMGRVAIHAGTLAAQGHFGEANQYLEQEGSAGDILGQTHYGAAWQVADEMGITTAQALNQLPKIPRDSDVAELVDRDQQSWFPGNRSFAAQAQAHNARQASLTNGRATTFGRAAGQLIGLSPGTPAYSIMQHLVKPTAGGAPVNLWNDPEAVERWRAREARRQLGVADTLFSGGIDLGVALGVDPVGKVSQARRAQVADWGRIKGATREIDLPERITVTSRVTDKASGVTRDVPINVDGGTRRTTVLENAVDWVHHTPAGDRAAQYLANADRYSHVQSVLGPNAHPRQVLRLMAEKDPAQVKHILVDELGHGYMPVVPQVQAGDMARVGMDPSVNVGDLLKMNVPARIGTLPVPRIAGLASATVRRPTARWRQMAPSVSFFPRSDPAWAVEQYRRQVHAMRVGAAREVLTPEYVDETVARFARGLVDDTADPMAPYMEMMNDVRQAIIAHDVPPNIATQLTRVAAEVAHSDRNMAIDAHSGAVKNVFMQVGGEPHPVPKAASEAEMFTDGIPAIDTVEFQRAVGKMKRLTSTPGWELLVAGGDAVNAMFRFLVLPGRMGAYVTRNMGEASTRLAVEGMEGATPMTTLMWRIADSPRSAASREIGRLERDTPRRADLQAMEQELRNPGPGGLDPTGQAFHHRAQMEKGYSAYARAMEDTAGPWSDTRTMHTGQYPVFRKTGNGGLPESGWHNAVRFTLAKWHSSGDYELAVKHPPQVAKDMFWRSTLRQRMARQDPGLNTREGSDQWIDFVNTQIMEFTNGNPKLINVIRRGTLDGVPLIRRGEGGALQGNQKFLNKLNDYMNDLPEHAVGPGQIRASTGMVGGLTRGAEIVERQVMQRLFTFANKPMNRFVNGPFMRSRVWQESARLAPLLDDTNRARLLANARLNKAGQGIIDQIAGVQGPPGNLTVEDVRDLAEHRAFTQWVDTLYNQHRKGNWAYTARFVAPFGNAVADMYRYYSKRLLQDPLLLHRVDQGLRGARQSGFFYTDDNGQERFAYPFARALSNVVGGDVGLTGRVQSANLITSGLAPSLGPIASFPLATVLPDNTQTDAIRAVVFPYGEPDREGGILESLLPTNGKLLISALGLGSPELKRQAADANAATMAYLAATRDYGQDEDGQRKLRQDAQHIGGMLRIVQAFAAGLLPASPKADAYTEDKTGRAVEIAMVAAEYRRLMREDPDTANVNLYKKYGDAVFLAVVGGTDSTGQNMTEEAHNLARSHPEVIDKYGKVWSYFTDPNSPFSFEEFHRQIQSRERAPRDLKQRQVKAQTSLANTVYFQYKDQFGPFPEADEQEYLRTVKAKLKERFPLWDTSYNANEVTDTVQQAFKAANDPVFASTQAGRAVRAYQQARNQVRDYYNEQGVTASESGFGRAKDAAPGRDYLRQVADKLSTQIPEFGMFWQRVFSRELVDD